jgi:hypothetical protein
MDVRDEPQKANLSDSAKGGFGQTQLVEPNFSDVMVDVPFRGEGKPNVNVK